MTALAWVSKTYRYDQRVFWRVPKQPSSPW